MNYKELRSEIFALGFEDSEKYSDNPDIFPTAVNRAISVITTEVRSYTAEVSISHFPLLSVASGENGVCKKGEDLVFTAKNAKCFAFYCNGSGSLKISDDEGERVMPLGGESGFVLYRDFLNGDAVLTFSGEYLYHVKGLGIYDSISSLNLHDILPNLSYIPYDLKEIDPDFVAFTDKGVLNDRGLYKNLSDYRIERRSVIYLPKEEAGEYIIEYKKLSPRLTADTTDDFIIPLDDDITVLLPLLASYYIWLDYDATKASIYRNEYEAMRNNILLREVKPIAAVLGGENSCL